MALKIRKCKLYLKNIFESIALGTYFAIKENNGVEGLDTDNISSWFNSEEYRNVVTSDAANNKSKLTARIDFVKTNYWVKLNGIRGTKRRFEKKG